jgi:benzoate-CoA ligase
MPGFCVADHAFSPPRISFPREYNLAHDLVGRNLASGRANKAAYIDERGEWTYAALASRVGRFANVLGELGIEAEQRVMICLLDGIDFPTAFLGSILAGVIPVAVNTMLTTDDYEYMLRDSRCRALVVSHGLLTAFAPLLPRLPGLRHFIVSGEASPPHRSLEALLSTASPAFAPAERTPDDACFWLYSSGSTGPPKGTIHAHASARYTAELHGRPIVGVREDDIVFSAAKLFFAYGLGNALTTPLAMGATAVLTPQRPTPAVVFDTLCRHQATVFCGVPTLFASMLASPDLPLRDALRVRVCTSAGEALPAELGRRWTAHFGSEILDGIGSTEMLHVFLSNRRGDVRYGSTGLPVPGYRVRVIDEAGAPVAPGEIGELQVDGPSAAIGYWNNREKSRGTFLGPWTRCGDKYTVDAEGYYTYVGRIDDMLKVGGIYVSPIEVEFALATHPAVLESAVTGKADAAALTKPIAYVVLKAGHPQSPALAEELKRHVKSKLAPYKYPRWIEFVDELPKTATGKIQRYKLRARAAAG